MRVLPFLKAKNGVQFAGEGFSSSGGGGGGSSSFDLAVGENVIGSLDGKNIICKVIKNINGSRSSGENYIENFTIEPANIISCFVSYKGSGSSWRYSSVYNTNYNGSYVSFSVSSSYSYDVEYVMLTYLADNV